MSAKHDPEHEAMMASEEAEAPAKHHCRWELALIDRNAPGEFFLRNDMLSGFVACIKCKDCDRVTTGLFPDVGAVLEACKKPRGETP